MILIFKKSLNTSLSYWQPKRKKKYWKQAEKNDRLYIQGNKNVNYWQLLNRNNRDQKITEQHFKSLKGKSCQLNILYPAKTSLKYEMKWSVSHSIMSDSFGPHGLQPARLLWPWDSPGKNTGVGFHFFLQGIFPTQGSNPGVPRCRQILYHLSHQGSWMRWSKDIKHTHTQLRGYISLSAFKNAKGNPSGLGKQEQMKTRIFGKTEEHWGKGKHVNIKDYFSS